MPALIKRPNVSSHDPIWGGAVGIALICPATPDAMVLLGDVRQVQEVREGAGDRQRLVHRHLLEDSVSLAKSASLPPRAFFDNARTRSTVSYVACPSWRRSVSPSSSPSKRTSSRRAFGSSCGTAVSATRVTQVACGGGASARHR